MLRAELIGNLGGDPEVRYTQKGEELVTVSVAVNQRKRVRDTDDWKEVTQWFRVRCPGWRGETAKKMAKGQRVFVCGRMEINEYVRRDGSPGFSYDIWADELHGLQSAPRADAAPNGSSNGARAAETSSSTSSTYTPPRADADLEDLPF